MSTKDIPDTTKGKEMELHLMDSDQENQQATQDSCLEDERAIYSNLN